VPAFFFAKAQAKYNTKIINDIKRGLPIGKPLLMCARFFKSSLNLEAE
jgi:hypothetical protein